MLGVPVNLWRLLLPVWLVFSARRAAGALGIRHSPRPLFGGWNVSRANLARKTRGGIADSYLSVIASAAKQSSFPSAAPWIASLSLSSGAHSRDPLARNDGLAV
jgi:hypothetical protein